MRLGILDPVSQKNFTISKIRDGVDGCLKNSKIKLRYLRNGTTDFDEVWRSDAT